MPKTEPKTEPKTATTPSLGSQPPPPSAPPAAVNANTNQNMSEADIQKKFFSNVNRLQIAALRRLEENNPGKINYRDLNTGGNTALLVAVKSVNNTPGALLQVVQHLVAHGCPLDVVDQHGWTALMYAANYGRAETVEFLVTKGCKLDIVDKQGWDVFLLATSTYRLNILRVLFGKPGCNAQRVDNEGRNALLLAAGNDNYSPAKCDVIKYLVGLQIYDINATDSDGRNLLMLAVPEPRLHIDANYNIPPVKYLIDKDCRLDARDNKGRTVFMHAVIKGNLDTVKFLVAKGCNPADAVVSNDGRTALMYAVGRDLTDILEFLLSEGANAAYVSPHGLYKGKKASDFATGTKKKFLLKAETSAPATAVAAHPPQHRATAATTRPVNPLAMLARVATGLAEVKQELLDDNDNNNDDDADENAAPGTKRLGGELTGSPATKKSKP